MRSTSLLTIIALIVVGAVALIMFRCQSDWCLVFDWQKANVADSFERCVELGFPVMESDPRQCRAGEKLFVEGRDTPVPTSGNGGTPTPVETDMVKVLSPLPNATVASPLLVRGEARGNWYFEASFPVRLLDASGREIATGIATAQGDWMTTEFVPFEARLTFAAPPTSSGTLVLERSNPSGLPQNAGDVRVPVRFANTAAQERTVTLYYYNEARDRDAAGVVQCSRRGLVAVNRNIPVTNTPIQDTIRLLLRGELTQAERSQGISTEFPLEGLTLTGANLSGNVLRLELNDPQNRTVGGSCRVGILFGQIEETAKQFDGVNSVEILPEELFQP
jgi:hypothetical protein